jgi:hypothetical protein
MTQEANDVLLVIEPWVISLFCSYYILDILSMHFPLKSISMPYGRVVKLVHNKTLDANDISCPGINHHNIMVSVHIRELIFNIATCVDHF